MERPVTGHPYLDDILMPPGSVIAMAHRGGAGHPDLLGLENTAVAFRHAVDQGYRYLETDAHLTADGRLVAFHDDVLDRVTDRSGRLESVPTEVWRSALIGGREPIPVFAELLEEFSDCRFNVDLKSAGAGAALADLLDAADAHDRVCVGSFSTRRIRAFRRRTGGLVATSASSAEVAAFVAVPFAGLASRIAGPDVSVLQVPHRRGPLPVVTRSLVQRAHRAGVHVHVWTVDEPDEMNQLLDLGVDGLITDRTELLKDVLIDRGLWRDRG